MKKNMKILIISALVIIIALGGLFIYKKYNSKNMVKGNKNIEVTVKSEKDNYEKMHTHSTNVETLGAALDEMEIVDVDTSQVSRFIIAADGLKVDENKSKQEWWNLKINGEDSQTGIDDTPIKDGDKIEIILTIGW
ncbi:MAG: DUF4430 domain-containing protein [Clostridium sp.]|uniref:DUF4430 domain-containing protein n=1 Tax=Clostridium sp. TaxID=1506 RepID=UPI003069D26C